MEKIDSSHANSFNFGVRDAIIQESLSRSFTPKLIVRTENKMLRKIKKDTSFISQNNYSTSLESRSVKWCGFAYS